MIGLQKAMTAYLRAKNTMLSKIKIAMLSESNKTPERYLSKRQTNIKLLPLIRLLEERTKMYSSPLMSQDLIALINPLQSLLKTLTHLDLISISIARESVIFFFRIYIPTKVSLEGLNQVVFTMQRRKKL